MDLTEIDWFGCRLNYLSFNGRFHLLTNDMAASTSSSLFDIIVTIIIVVLIIVIVISKIIIIINAIGVSYLSYPWLCFVRRTVMSSQSRVNWRKIVLASVELNRLLPHNFRVTECRPDGARHLKSSGSVYKIDLKNKIFSLFSN